MKIGEFSKCNNLSIDTIRYYMDMQLLIPQKKGSQYEFDYRCQEDLNIIIEYKNMGFTISEIKTIFTYKSLGKLLSLENKNYFKALFKDKLNENNTKIRELDSFNRKIKDNIEEIKSIETLSKTERGIDLSLLNILSCLNCKKELTLEEGTIRNNEIIHGKLKCDCGSYLIIQSGILYTNVNNINKIDETNDYLIEEYIKNTDNSYTENIRKSLRWVNKKIETINLNNKVILELGSGIGFLIRSIYDILPSNTTYILIDNDINKHKYLMDIIRGLDNKKRLLLICTDFKEIPIKENSVDILLDGSGSSNYWFYNNDFLLDEVTSHLKYDAKMISSYLCFKNIREDNFINKENRKHFNVNILKKELELSNFNKIDDYISDSLGKPGIYEDYFREDEEVFSYLYYGKRLG